MAADSIQYHQAYTKADRLEKLCDKAKLNQMQKDGLKTALSKIIG